MRKHGKVILLSISAVLNIVLLCFLLLPDFTSDPGSTPSTPNPAPVQAVSGLTWEQKEMIETACGQEIEWYDENVYGYHVDYGVYRYVGTYDDCIALLTYGYNITSTMEPNSFPYRINELPRRVYAYDQVDVFIYNQGDVPEGKKRLLRLATAERNEWLTDSQVEQLCQDIERIFVNPFERSATAPWLKWDVEVANKESGYPSIEWYHPNNVEGEENVWQFLSYYGNCYAFLRIDGTVINEPSLIPGLSRDVYYRYEAEVMLYRMHPETGRTVVALQSVEDRGEWLSDSDLEELTKDIEKIAKSH